MNGLIIALVIIAVALVAWMLWRKERFVVDDTDSAYITQLKKVIEIIYPPATQLNILPGRQSMTIEKKTVYICLRDPITHQYYPFDVLLFVTLHEIAHVMSKSYSAHSHNGEFHANFNELLSAAAAHGYFASEVKIPKNYCSG